MRTTFALFQKYDDAQKAVEDLLGKNFGKQEINIIAQKMFIDGNWNVKERGENVNVTKRGGQKAGGLDEMIGRRQPIQTNSAGELYAAGERANVLAKTLVAPGTVDGGLEGALEDFGVSDETASELADGIRGGQMLFFIRTPDDRAAEVIDLLSQDKARSLTTVRG